MTKKDAPLTAGLEVFALDRDLHLKEIGISQNVLDQNGIEYRIENDAVFGAIYVLPDQLKTAEALLDRHLERLN
ncbi:MAG: hypothetical protein ACE5JU_25800 [Candidatus Binatia bacterium]